MVYRPAPSEIATRLPSIRAGLEASTVTPGRTPPVLSLTSPVMELWANAAAGNSTRQASTASALRAHLACVIFAGYVIFPSSWNAGCTYVDTSAMDACDHTEKAGGGRAPTGRKTSRSTRSDGRCYHLTWKARRARRPCSSRVGVA